MTASNVKDENDFPEMSISMPEEPKDMKDKEALVNYYLELRSVFYQVKDYKERMLDFYQKKRESTNE
jgi:hypothetical protein